METSVSTRKELVLQRTYMEVSETQKHASNLETGNSERYHSSIFEHQISKIQQGSPTVHQSNGQVPNPGFSDSVTIHSYENSSSAEDPLNTRESRRNNSWSSSNQRKEKSRDLNHKPGVNQNTRKNFLNRPDLESPGGSRPDVNSSNGGQNVRDFGGYKNGGIFDYNYMKNNHNKGGSSGIGSAESVTDTGTDLDEVPQEPLIVHTVQSSVDHSPSAPESGIDSISEKIKKLEELLQRKSSSTHSSGDVVKAETIIGSLPGHKNGFRKIQTSYTNEELDSRSLEPFNYARAQDYVPFKNHSKSRSSGDVRQRELDIGFRFADPEDYAPLREQLESAGKTSTLVHAESRTKNATTPEPGQLYQIPKAERPKDEAPMGVAIYTKYFASPKSRAKKNNKSNNAELVFDQEKQVHAKVGHSNPTNKLATVRQDDKVDGSGHKKGESQTNLFFDTLVFLGDCFMCHGERP